VSELSPTRPFVPYYIKAYDIPTTSTVMLRLSRSKSFTKRFKSLFDWPIGTDSDYFYIFFLITRELHEILLLPIFSITRKSNELFQDRRSRD